MTEQPLKVLLIYQGDAATPFRKHVSERLAAEGALTEEVGFSPGTGLPDIQRRFRDAMLSCDGCIALITEDPRPSSAAGNVWFELGCWYGRRGCDSLLLLIQESIDSEDSVAVKMISNLKGAATPHFSEPKDMDHEVGQFVSILNGTHGPSATDKYNNTGNYAPKAKLRDTLCIGQSLHGLDAYDKCPYAEDLPVCDHRGHSLEFLSELLRMGRANYESAEVEAHLFQIAETGWRITASDELVRPESKNRAWKQRRDYMSALWDHLASLHRFGLDFLCRSDAHDDSDKLTPWERLENYLMHRLLETAETDFDRDLLRGKVGLFLSSIQDLISKPYFEYEYYKSEVVGEIANREKNTIDNVARHALLFVNELNSQSSAYFSRCREKIRTGLSSVQELTSLPGAFRGIISDLPHQDPEREYPRIWPSRDKNAAK